MEVCKKNISITRKKLNVSNVHQKEERILGNFWTGSERNGGELQIANLPSHFY